MTDDPDIIDVTPDPEPEETPKKDPEKPRRGRFVIILLLIVLIGGVAGGVYFKSDILTALGLPAPEQATTNAAPDPALLKQIEALEQRLAELENSPAPEASPAVDLQPLETRISALETAPPSGVTAGVDLQPLQDQQRQIAQQLNTTAQQVAQLSSRVTAAENKPTPVPNDASEAEVQALTDQLSSLFDQQIAQQQRITALERAGTQDIFQPVSILALSRLRQAVEASVPYEAALTGVKRLFEARGSITRSGQQAVDQLGASSATGIPSMTSVKTEFETLVPEIMAARTLPEEADWLDRTWASVQNAVTVRQTGEIEGDSVDAIVARAEQDMERNDLAAAADELSKLTGRPANVAAPWLDTARIRLASLKALDTLEAALAEDAPR